MDFRKLIIVGLTMLATAGCSSNSPKADISAGASPQEELTKLDQDINAGIQKHADVLAEDDFKEAQKYLKEAKEDIASKESQKEILDDLRKGRGFLDRAIKTAEQRAPRVQGILDARQAAVDAGARNFPKQTQTLKSYDDDLRDEAKSLGNISPDQFAKMQQNYMGLALASTQETQLGKARGMITGSIDSGAKKKAPRSLKAAETDLKNAENVIAANRNMPSGYVEAVSKSNLSARFLQNVVATVHEHKGLDETAAMEMVRSKMQIAELKGDLKDANTETQELGQTLATKNQQLATAQSAISVQQAIESARKEFDSSEAEVFQQGEKLVVRLKSMQFSSGRAELPSASLALLAKVKDVAASLNPSQVVVEGHTDSTGTAAKNLTLSQSRAQTVATYLGENGLEQGKISSVGYGIKKPIASNKSADGRAQNRRVDVIITPATAKASL